MDSWGRFPQINTEESFDNEGDSSTKTISLDLLISCCAGSIWYSNIAGRIEIKILFMLKIIKVYAASIYNYFIKNFLIVWKVKM